MELFKVTKEKCSILGLSAHQSNQKYPFNSKNLVTIVVLYTGAFLAAMNLLWGASTFQEFTESIYITSTLFATALNYTTHVYKMKMIFKFLEDFENFINSSK